MEYRFKFLEQDWFKRRRPDSVKKSLTDFEVFDFRKEESGKCRLFAIIDEKEYFLEARIYQKESYEYQEDGSVKIISLGWGIQALGPHGISVILNLIE